MCVPASIFILACQQQLLHYRVHEHSLLVYYNTPKYSAVCICILYLIFNLSCTVNFDLLSWSTPGLHAVALDNGLSTFEDQTVKITVTG